MLYLLTGSALVIGQEGLATGQGIEVVYPYQWPGFSLAEAPWQQSPGVWVLDHPLGLVGHFKGKSRCETLYLQSAWLAFAMWLQQAGCFFPDYSAFQEWRWTCAYLYSMLATHGKRHVGEDIWRSGQRMPFYWRSECSMTVVLDVKIASVWQSWPAQAKVDDELRGLLASWYPVQILTTEYLSCDGQLIFLQAYPGLPWGHGQRCFLLRLLRTLQRAFAPPQSATLEKQIHRF